jgi:anaerobic selenocysteine-containing dehydrogenase
MQFPENEFPEYYETDEKKREQIIAAKNASDPDIKVLETIANAILHADAKEIKCTPKGTKDRYGDEEYTLEVTGNCANALQAFRDYLKPQGVIKKGKHFNAELLVKAFEKYVSAQYTAFGGTWNSPKNLLFWRQVIGYIERYLPASSAQAFCQGLYNVTEGGQSLNRDLKLDGGVTFFPSVPSSCSGLGFDHGVYGAVWWRGGPGGAGGGGSARSVRVSGPRFTKLMSNKNRSYSSQLMQPCPDSHSKKGLCVIL